MTEFAPDCFISGAFSCSRTAATIQASGLAWRTVSVASTLESSRSVVMMTWSASPTPARRRTSLAGRVAGHDGQAVVVGLGQRGGAVVDDDDALLVEAVADAAS